jgi:hypothetical protein
MLIELSHILLILHKLLLIEDSWVVDSRLRIFLQEVLLEDLLGSLLNPFLLLFLHLLNKIFISHLASSLEVFFKWILL